MRIEAIDLFCGAGGLSYGLSKAGINVLAGLDNDNTCKYIFEKNIQAKFILANIEEFNFKEISNLFSKDSKKILVGCAPCQPFSHHSYKYKKRENDARWTLAYYFVNAIDVIKPHIISMENVEGFSRSEVFENILFALSKKKYYCSYKVVNCAQYGIPQHRRRLVLLASKFGNIDIPAPTHAREKYVPIKKVIGNLAKINSGETDKNDLLHKSKNLFPINIKRIQQSSPNGTWRDWDAEILPECYKKKSGESFSSVYGRMDWDKISPTITTQFYNYGSGRFGHPEQDRALSLREGAILQTFPPKYDFGTNIAFSSTGRHIGNAVPPKLGKIIGNTIIKHLNQNE